MSESRAVAVVTGGSRGIGRAIVLEAARRGFDVVFSHRGRSDDAEQTARDACEVHQDGSRGRVLAVEARMEEEAGLCRLAQMARDAGDVRLLIANAGVLSAARLEEVRDNDWYHSFQVHAAAPMILARELRGELERHHGAIVAIASDGAVVGSVHGVSYGASKAATIGLIHTLARELAPAVRVNTLAPGPVATRMWNDVPAQERAVVESSIPLARVGTAEEIARCALDLASWSYVTGQTVLVDGGRSMR